MDMATSLVQEAQEVGLSWLVASESAEPFQVFAVLDLVDMYP